jgi:hypothetical protein
MENNKMSQSVPKLRANFKLSGCNATIERKLNFINLYKESACNTAYCLGQTGMTRRSLNRWIQNDPEFKEALNDVQEALFDNAEARLQKLIEEGKEGATMFFLKTKCKHRGYTEKQEIQHSGAIGGELIVKLVKPDGTEYKN